MASTVIHGGDVWAIAADCDIPVESLLDFSANINPAGLPQIARMQLEKDAADSTLLAKYPDPAYTSLRSVLADREGISLDSILIGEGAEALIGATLRAIAPKRCLLPIPAFGEYERACKSSKTDVETIQLKHDNNFSLDSNAFVEMLQSAQCDFAIVNNPHNPSGALMRKQNVIELVERCRTSDAFVLVDEAFIDYTPGESIVQYASRTREVLAVRSLTKFFGCPALRVGYAVGHPDTLKLLSEHLPTWPVTILASNALQAALQADGYDACTLSKNHTARRALVLELEKLGAQVASSSANYLLIRLKQHWPDSSTTREFLIRNHRIVVRNCNSFAGLEKGRYIRVAIRTESENNLLLEGLQELWK